MQYKTFCGGCTVDAALAAPILGLGGDHFLAWKAIPLVWTAATHALIRNLPRASRSLQNPGLQKNADGSVNIYFAPTAPAGKESNWVPTSADGKFEVLFRLYGPEKPLFDKTWKLPDIEEEK